MGSIFYTPEDFKEYIGVYVSIVAISSTAFFVFCLPKVIDYFNNLNYRRYKEMLDLRKSLVDNNRTIDRRINKMIDHYEDEFIRTRENKIWNPSRLGFHGSALMMLGFIFLVIALVLWASMCIYQYLFLAWFIR